MAERVPRLIHIIWLGSEIPPQVDRLREGISRHDPGVEVRVWRDEDLGWLQNSEAFEAERRYPAKADIARYEILWRHGGIYLDADMRVHGSLAPVFDGIESHGAVVARQSRAVYNNAFLAAAPGHPLLAGLVAAIPDAYRWTGRMTAPATTGPHLLTEGIMAFVGAGGTLMELPQHAVYPWYSDEEPLPDVLVPRTTLMSHDWASTGGWADGTTRDGTIAPIADRRSRAARSSRSLRARAAASPAVHAAVARAERRRAAVPRRRPVTPGPGADLSPTDEILERSVARLAARELRGSAALLDVHPVSMLPFLAAGRVLDRAGRAVVVLDDADVDLIEPAWRDASTRSSMHVIACSDVDSMRISRIASVGSSLLPRVVSQEAPPVGAVTTVGDGTLASLVEAIPRFDLVRIRADRLQASLADVLESMFIARRVRRMVVTVDPFGTQPGVGIAVDLIAALESTGSRITIGPWLVDGRGRTWREHLRVAARPFLVLAG